MTLLLNTENVLTNANKSMTTERMYKDFKFDKIVNSENY